jgi:hypothetical protein
MYMRARKRKEKGDKISLIPFLVDVGLQGRLLSILEVPWGTCYMLQKEVLL